MATRARATGTRTDAAADVAADVPVVGAREPCPCGSGRRYKACHGRAARVAQPVLRPFQGLAGECDWVALREIVPAATAALTLRDAGPAGSPREATLSTVLPMGYPAMVRLDGQVFVGLQSTASSDDVSRDVGTALATALEAEPGTLVPPATGSDGPRLQDLLDVSAPLGVTVRSGFEYWIEGMPEGDRDPEVAASLERANSGVVPTVRLVTVEAAYWASMADRTTLRWVLPHDEEPLLDALARLHAAGAIGLGEGTRFIGTFRAHGLLVPVWDLPAGAGADDAEDPASDFRARLTEALADSGALTSAQRHARAGLQTRQLTLR